MQMWDVTNMAARVANKEKRYGPCAHAQPHTPATLLPCCYQTENTKATVTDNSRQDAVQGNGGSEGAQQRGETEDTCHEQQSLAQPLHLQDTSMYNWQVCMNSARIRTV